jgi:hypothetical protein
MSEPNVDRVIENDSEIFVNHPATTNSIPLFENMEVLVLEDGSEVRTWLSAYYRDNQAAVVARWIPEGDLILGLDIQHSVDNIHVEFRTLGGSVKCASYFSTKRSITYDYLGRHVHEAMMLQDGCSQFINVKLVHGSAMKSPSAFCWNPDWVESSLGPSRRLFGKQSYHLRKTLDERFAKFQGPPVWPPTN